MPVSFRRERGAICCGDSGDGYPNHRLHPDLLSAFPPARLSVRERTQVHDAFVDRHGGTDHIGAIDPHLGAESYGGCPLCQYE